MKMTIFNSGLFDSHYGDNNPKTTWTWVDNSPFKFEKFEFGARVHESELVKFIETPSVQIG